MLQKKLNLFIVGAAKSGTTSLWYSLKENPQVFMPKTLMVKEPAYFSNLRKLKYSNYENYMGLFSEANQGHIWIGEASTAYLTDPDSARQIFDYNADAKIIMLLRNPVQRAHSLYNWMVQDGYEYAVNFEKALLLEPERQKRTIPNYYEPEYYNNYLYFNSGLYYSQVKRYKALFGKNSIIVKFEDFVKNFDSEYAKICDFIGIKPNRLDDSCKNESSAVISAPLQFLLRKLTIFFFCRSDELMQLKINNREVEFKQKITTEFFTHMQQLKKITPIGFVQHQKIVRLIKRLTNKLYHDELKLSRDTIESRDVLMKCGLRTHPPRKMKPRTASILKEKYRPDILNLSTFTGMDFSDWRI